MSKGWDEPVRSLDLLIGAGLLVAPRQLRWSLRSSRLMSLAGLLLIGASVLIRVLGGRSRTAMVARVVEGGTGATLVGAQYLLSEEDSSVRGTVAAIGAALMFLALIRRPDLDSEESALVTNE